MKLSSTRATNLDNCGPCVMPAPMALHKITVPEIDLAGPEDEALDLIREACTTSGFFVIKNHGIEKDLLNAALEKCKALFSLSDDQKLALKSDILFTGYQPYGGIHVDPAKDQKEGDRREGFYSCKGAPWIGATQPNEWPDQWPSNDILPGFADTDSAFCQASLRLTRQIARLLSKVLNQPEDWLESNYFQDPFVALHNLHYAPVKSEPEKGILGLGAHSDFGLFTFLLCNEPGLQILTGEEWRDLAVDGTSLIVNLGDELQRCTNDKFKSQVHRVVNFGKDRYSVAFFVNADYESTLNCLPTCCEDGPAKYQPIKSSDFMTEKFNAVHKT